MNNKKVVVGMSGGVDSSVCAYLLKKQGYEVIGATMQTLGEGANAEMIADAKRICEQLDIPHLVMDFTAEFKQHVQDYFVDEYMHGRTPNPCIACNRFVKWESLLKSSLEMGADYIATGHYAKITKLSNGRYSVANSVTAEKDQTYVLYNLTQEQLSHTMMPIGDYAKSDIRKIALEIGLDVASKPDSQDICFIPDHDYGGYIKSVVGSAMPDMGDFVLTDGTVVGQHKGITNYTVGQRKHLGIALGKPVFVKRIDVSNNQIVLGDDADVYTDTLVADRLNCMSVTEFKVGEEYVAKIRYSDPGSRCIIESVESDRIRLSFPEKVRAVTPGQAVVLYQGEYVAGGATIL